MITKFPSHLAKGLSRVIEQWKDKAVVNAICKMILVECQRIEDAFGDIADSRLIDNVKCADRSLELVGGLVGEPRRGRVDAVYKLWIKARVKVNKSNGEFDELIEIIDIVESSDYIAEEYFPAALYYEFGDLVDAPASDLFEMLKEAKSGGVWLGMIYGDVTDDPFSCCAGTAVEANVDEGFGLTDLSTGGEMSHVFST